LHQSRTFWFYRNTGTQLIWGKDNVPSIGATETKRNEKEIARHQYIYTLGEESQIEVIWKSKTQRPLGTREQFRRKIDFQIEWKGFCGPAGGNGGKRVEKYVGGGEGCESCGKWRSKSTREVDKEKIKRTGTEFFQTGLSCFVLLFSGDKAENGACSSRQGESSQRVRWCTILPPGSVTRDYGRVPG
jgi:hypothetical protein